MGWLLFFLLGVLPAAFWHFLAFNGKPNCLEFIVVLFHITLGIVAKLMSENKSMK